MKNGREISSLPRGLTTRYQRETSISSFVAMLDRKVEGSWHTVFDSSVVQLKKSLQFTFLGQCYTWSLVLISIASTLQFIYSSYVDDSFELLNYSSRTELGVTSLFAFDWCLNLVIADHPIDFILSFLSVVDIIIVFSVFSTYTLTPVHYVKIKSTYEGVKYILFFGKRVRILRAIRLTQLVSRIQDAVKRQLCVIILTVSLMLLFFASCIQYLEFQTNQFSFHTWMYFIWITLTTVGYGDITAKTVLGRIAVMIMIAVAIILIPNLTNELVEIINLESSYIRAYYSPKTQFSQHIILCGNLHALSYSSFFNQLFHEDHKNYDLTVVILSPDPPSLELLLLIKSNRYDVQYLQGTPFSEIDLKRAKAETASAVFLLANKFSHNVDEEDARTILINLNIKQYIASSFSLTKSLDSFQANLSSVQNYRHVNLFCLQLNRSENRRHLYDDDFIEMMNHDLIICFNEIKLGIMAKSVIQPGVASFLLNLITSFSEEDLYNASLLVEESDLLETTLSGKLTKSAWKL
jgi:voltage-gated potassium channel Kch